jgi:hypothetical protein
LEGHDGHSHSTGITNGCVTALHGRQDQKDAATHGSSQSVSGNVTVPVTSNALRLVHEVFAVAECFGGVLVDSYRDALRHLARRKER